MLTNLVRELDDHDLSVLHTRNTQNGLVGVACVNPLHKQISPTGTGPFNLCRCERNTNDWNGTGTRTGIGMNTAFKLL